MRPLKTTTSRGRSSPAEAHIRPGRLSIGLIERTLTEQALRVPLLIPIGLAAGAAIYLTAGIEPSWTIVLLPTLLCAFLLVWAHRAGFQAVFWLTALALATTVGLLAAKTRTSLIAAPVLIAETGPSRIEGRLVEIDANDRNKRLRLRVAAIEGLAPDATPKFVRFSYRYPIDFAPGRAVICSAILSPPPTPTVPGDYAFHRDAWFDQLGAVGFAVAPCTPAFSSSPTNLYEWITLRTAAVRHAIASHVLSVAGDKGGALAAAMIAGDRSNIAQEDVEALRGSGLAHLLAISGLHMALAGGAFLIGIRMLWPFTGPLALKVPAIKVAAAGAIVGCTVYYLLSGGSVATQRAYIMALIAFSAKLIDKPALSLRSLSIAFGLIVLLRPEAVVTPGFQMSFAASGALIGTFEHWSSHLRARSAALINRFSTWIGGATATSITASLATMPFALHHFDRAAAFGIIANLAVTPIISFWAAPTAAAAMVASIIGLQDPFLAFLGTSLEAVLFVAHATTRYAPVITLPPVDNVALVLLAIGIGAYSILTGAGRALSIVPLALGIVALTQAERPAGYIATNRTVYLEADGSWLSIHHWETSQTLSPLSIGGKPQKLECSPVMSACERQFGDAQLTLTFNATKEGQRTASPKSDANEPCNHMNAELNIRPAPTATWLKLDPCGLPPDTAATIYREPAAYRLKLHKMATDRPWSPRARQAQ